MPTATTVTSSATDGQVLTSVSNVATWKDVNPRAQALLTAQGPLSENYPRTAGSTNTPAIAGTIYLSAIGVLKGDVITNVHLVVGAAGTTSGSSLAKVGLYDSSGNLLRASADLGATWESTGAKTHALSSTYTVTATGAIYVAFVGNNGTTMPSFLRSGSLTIGASPIGANIRSYGTGGTGQTDLPNSITPATGTPIAYWVAVS